MHCSDLKHLPQRLLGMDASVAAPIIRRQAIAASDAVDLENSFLAEEPIGLCHACTLCESPTLGHTGGVMSQEGNHQPVVGAWGPAQQRSLSAGEEPAVRQIAAFVS